VSLRTEHRPEPVAHGWFLDTQLVQDRQHLDMNVSFLDADPEMIGLRVPGPKLELFQFGDNPLPVFRELDKLAHVEVSMPASRF